MHKAFSKQLPLRERYRLRNEIPFGKAARKIFNLRLLLRRHWHPADRKQLYRGGVVSCQHLTPINSTTGKCELHLFGGFPSIGVCRTCEHYDGDDAKPLPPPLPGPLEMLKSFATASKKWADAGFPTVTEDQYQSRVDDCEGCSEWDEKARLGMGKCNACGCTGLKRWLATEQCPKNKWPTI